MSLGADEWQSVGELLQLDPRALCALAATCREARAAAAVVMHGAKLAHLGDRRVLNQGALCEALHISPEEARALPHRVERAKLSFSRGSYDTHWFDLAEALSALLKNLGGWPALAARLAQRAAKKRKRADLDERRDEAAQKRRAALDAWLAKKRPLGASIGSVGAWTVSLEARGAAAPSSDATLRAFLGSAALKAPELAEAQRALVGFEAAQVKALARAAAEEAAAAARKAEVVAVLTERGHALDETLHWAQCYASPHSHGGAWKCDGAQSATLGRERAVRMADRIVGEQQQRAQAAVEAAEKAVHQVEAKARRKALVAQLRRRKLVLGTKDAALKELYAAYESKGTLDGQPSSAEAVAEAARAYPARAAALAAALAAVNVDRAVMAAECATFERRGTLGGEAIDAEGVARELARRVQEKRLVAQARADDFAEGARAERAVHEANLAAIDAFSRERTLRPLHLPPEPDNKRRKAYHTRAQKHGLFSESIGTGGLRRVVVRWPG